MDDDEIDDWLDSSDDEAGEASGATPRTQSFLAETTPDSTPAREAVAGAPVEEAPVAAGVAEAPAGVPVAREEAPAASPAAPPSDPTPSAVSVEPASPVAEAMTDLSLSSPRAADLRDPSRPRAASFATIDEARVSPEEPVPASVAVSEGGTADARVSPASPPGADAGTGDGPNGSADAADAASSARKPKTPTRVPGASEDASRASASSDAPVDAVGGGDGSNPAWTLRRAGDGAPETRDGSEPSFFFGAAGRDGSRGGFGFGSGSLLGASLGSVTAAVRAAARSDLARDALDRARGVGKELGTLARHAAGEDLASGDGDEDEDEDGSGGASRDAPPDDLWGAFGAMAMHAAKSLETAAVSVATDPNVRRVASRSAAAAKRAVAVAETKALDFLERTLADSGSDAKRTLAAIADADGAALERALIERGCAAHLETLETLADAADALAAEALRDAARVGGAAGGARSAFHPDVLASLDAALDVERVARDGEPPLSASAIETAARAAGGPVPGEDASELTASTRADAEAASRIAAASAFGAFSASLRAPDGIDARGDAERETGVSSESIETALVAALEPVRREAAARVADVAAAVVAHLADVAAALERAPGTPGREAEGGGTDELRWPSPLRQSDASSKTSSSADAGTTDASSDDGAAASIALARARLIGARARAMAADAEGVADAFAAATMAAFASGGSVGVDADPTVSSLFPDPEAFAAFAASVETHARTTAARLKEVATGYAADASRCLRAVVAASAEDAAAAR